MTKLLLIISIFSLFVFAILSIIFLILNIFINKDSVDGFIGCNGDNTYPKQLEEDISTYFVLSISLKQASGEWDCPPVSLGIHASSTTTPWDSKGCSLVLSTNSPASTDRVSTMSASNTHNQMDSDPNTKLYATPEISSIDPVCTTNDDPPSPPLLNWIQHDRTIQKYINKLNCIYTNATSLNTTKLHELIAITSMDKPHIIFITETWFTDTSNSIIPNYKVFRADRSTHGGGIAIYTRSDLRITELPYPHTHSEQLWLKLETINEKITLGCIYRPPPSPRNVSLTTSADNEIIKNIKMAKKWSKNGGLLITGDFNFPNIAWGPENYIKVVGSFSPSAQTSPIHWPN